MRSTGEEAPGSDSLRRAYKQPRPNPDTAKETMWLQCASTDAFREAFQEVAGSDNDFGIQCKQFSLQI